MLINFILDKILGPKSTPVYTADFEDHQEMGSSKFGRAASELFYLRSGQVYMGRGVGFKTEKEALRHIALELADHLKGGSCYAEYETTLPHWGKHSMSEWKQIAKELT